MTTILLHPVGLDRHAFDQVECPTATAVDFPRRIDVPAEFSLASLVDMVLNSYAGEPLDLVGVSLGSMVAQQVAIAHPSVVRSLVLACGGPRSDPATAVQRAAAARAGGMAGIIDETLARWFTAQALGDAGHPGVAYARKRLLADDPHVFARYWEAMSAHDVTDRLGQIVAPTTVIAGSDDVSAPVELMRRMADSMPNAEFVIVDGPHLLPLENARGFSTAVSNHLRRLG